jgi:hypothetical protein
MVDEPDDAVLPILRDIQRTLAEHGRDLGSIKAELRRQGVRMDELFESSTMALGLAGHANVRHESVQKQIDELKERLERLEAKVE